MNLRNIAYAVLGALLFGGILVAAQNSSTTTSAPAEDVGSPAIDLGPIDFVANAYTAMRQASGCGANSSSGVVTCSISAGDLSTPEFAVEPANGVSCFLEAAWSPLMSCEFDNLGRLLISSTGHPLVPCGDDLFATLSFVGQGGTLSIDLKGDVNDTAHCGPDIDHSLRAPGGCEVDSTPPSTINYVSTFTAASFPGVPGGVEIATADIAIPPEADFFGTPTVDLTAGTVTANVSFPGGSDDCGGPFGTGYVVTGVLTNGDTYSVVRGL